LDYEDSKNETNERNETITRIFFNVSRPDLPVPDYKLNFVAEIDNYKERESKGFDTNNTEIGVEQVWHSIHYGSEIDTMVNWRIYTESRPSTGVYINLHGQPGVTFRTVNVKYSIMDSNFNPVQTDQNSVPCAKNGTSYTIGSFGIGNGQIPDNWLRNGSLFMKVELDVKHNCNSKGEVIHEKFPDFRGFRRYLK